MARSVAQEANRAITSEDFRDAFDIFFTREDVAEEGA